MIKARHHSFIYPFFQFYSDYIISRDFSEVVFHNSFNDKGLPILLIENHVSWWDGFLPLHFNKLHLNRKFHIMMLEEQLKKYWYFNQAGAYSIRKGSRSIIDSIDYTAEILKDPSNMVVLFPQGKIESTQINEIHFEKGISKIIRKLHNPVQLLFSVVFFDYFSKRKPGVNFYTLNFDYNNKNHYELQLEYNRFYSDCKILQCKNTY